MLFQNKQNSCDRNTRFAVLFPHFFNWGEDFLLAQSGRYIKWQNGAVLKSCGSGGLIVSFWERKKCDRLNGSVCKQ